VGSIVRAVLSPPLAPGASVVLRPSSFVAAGFGDHELQVTIRSVTPAETDVADNTLAIDMTVVAVVKPPPNGGGFSLDAAIFASGRAVAAVAAALIAPWPLLRPRSPG